MGALVVNNLVIVVAALEIEAVLEEGVTEAKTEVVLFDSVPIPPLVIVEVAADNSFVGDVCIVAAVRVLFSKAVVDRVAKV